MKTTELLKVLSDEIEKYNEIINGLHCYGTTEDFFEGIEFNLNPSDVFDEGGYSISTIFFKDEIHKTNILKSIEEVICSCFKEMYTRSKIENFYWNFCSSRTYKSTYDERLNEYLDRNDDDGKDEGDFVKNELKLLAFHMESDYLNFIDNSIVQKIKDQAEEKIKFLSSKISTEVIPTADLVVKGINIFTSKKAEDLFVSYWECYKEDGKRVLANFSFIYRVMYRDGYINEYVRPEMFKNEISKAPYNIFIEHSLKTINLVDSVERKNRYYLLKQQIKN